MFCLALLKRLATRALKISLSRIPRVTFDKRKPRFSSLLQNWLLLYGDEIYNVSTAPKPVVDGAPSPPPSPTRQLMHQLNLNIKQRPCYNMCPERLRGER